eukprot:1161440-Pelagomonas_calceolata.AAC.2
MQLDATHIACHLHVHHVRHHSSHTQLGNPIGNLTTPALMQAMLFSFSYFSPPPSLMSAALLSYRCSAISLARISAIQC